MPAVYPRRCGEAGKSSGPIRSRYGLSPQVRGSRAAGPFPPAPAGSIPAGAGKPRFMGNKAPLAWVYPRRCGEALGLRDGRPNTWGLSPQVRGSPRTQGGCYTPNGSIPAGAGKPLQVRVRPSSCGVYPRRCGEAAPAIRCRCRSTGLSPQVRGSLAGTRSAITRAGSIPAGAGKPPIALSWLQFAGVYPRRCGEAARNRVPRARSMGLSPQVRGSPSSGLPAS